MNKSEQVEYQILEDFREGRKSRKQAALLLGISERSISRRVRKLRVKGLGGIKHGNYGRSPKNKSLAEVRLEILTLIKERYFDFNISHAYERLRDEHDFGLSYVTLLKWCHSEGIVRGKRRRSSKARVYRERMANEGILIQMDGSHHKWNGKDSWCLISVIDDASSNIPVGQFYEGETSWNCMNLLKQLFEARGIPQFIYTDGAGWAGGGGKRQNFAQVVRACEELGIKIIRAHSAQAKGRIERSYRAIQDRLIPELRLHKITTMKDANRYLEQVFWPEWNNRFSVEAKDPISRYGKLRVGESLEDILCMKYERQVNSDHTINYENRRYKITSENHGSLRKKKVVVHEYEDQSIKIFYANEPLEYSEIKLPKRRWR